LVPCKSVACLVRCLSRARREAAAVMVWCLFNRHITLLRSTVCNSATSQLLSRGALSSRTLSTVANGASPRSACRPFQPCVGSSVMLRSSLPTTSTNRFLVAAGMQVRGFAGRVGGFKRKKKSDWTQTVYQRGLGKRMEFYWPKKTLWTRVPLYENSRRHVIYDHRLKRWLVMWYRHGMQVFKAFGASNPSVKFEQGRMRAITFFQQLQNAGKLGRPKPDQCRSGVRGVVFDREERAWVARWNHCGMRMNAVYGTQELGFEEAYKSAVKSRVNAMRDQHKFMFQRTRFSGNRKKLGTYQT